SLHGLHLAQHLCSVHPDLQSEDEFVLANMALEATTIEPDQVSASASPRSEGAEIDHLVGHGFRQFLDRQDLQGPRGAELPLLSENQSATIQVK
ncbi:MAG: hypothetical protein WBW40_01455, partial [Thermoplasmata archaeon]